MKIFKKDVSHQRSTPSPFPFCMQFFEQLALWLGFAPSQALVQVPIRQQQKSARSQEKFLVFLVALCAASLTSNKAVAEDAIGNLGSIIGKATILRNGKPLPAQKGMAIFASDELQTGARTAIKINFNDGGNFMAFEDSKVKIAEYKFKAEGSASSVKSAFEIAKGKVRFFVKPEPGRKNDAKYATSNAVMGIRGTSGFIDASKPGSTQLVVLTGKVQVENPKFPGQSVLVPPNQMTSVASASAPTPPRAAPPQMIRSLNTQAKQVDPNTGNNEKPEGATGGKAEQEEKKGDSKEGSKEGNKEGSKEGPKEGNKEGGTKAEKAEPTSEGRNGEGSKAEPSSDGRSGEGSKPEPSSEGRNGEGSKPEPSSEGRNGEGSKPEPSSDGSKAGGAQRESEPVGESKGASSKSSESKGVEGKSSEAPGGGATKPDSAAAPDQAAGQKKDNAALPSEGVKNEASSTSSQGSSPAPMKIEKKNVFSPDGNATISVKNDALNGMVNSKVLPAGSGAANSPAAASVKTGQVTPPSEIVKRVTDSVKSNTNKAIENATLPQVTPAAAAPASTSRSVKIKINLPAPPK